MQRNVADSFVILDTDMGPDVDDAGALALAHILSGETGARLLAVTHCTSNPFGCGCIDAINRAYGHPDIPIGTLKKEGFLDAPEYRKYNRYITEHYPNRFSTAVPPDAHVILRQSLRNAPDGAVTFIAIGPLVNLAKMLGTEEGRALIRQKVKLLVSMSGCFLNTTGAPAAEWNVAVDIPSAKAVLENWPSPVALLPYETGAPVITGVDWGHMPKEHPVRKAYALYAPEGRPSWDLLAVWFAFKGPEPFFKVSPSGFVKVAENGHTEFRQAQAGHVRLISLELSSEKTGHAIDALWR